MAPRPGVLSTPELVELVARPTPWKYPMLCNKWLLPNLTEKTASGWMEFLSQLRLGMVLSWLGFILLPSSGKDGCLPVFLRAFSGLLYGCGALVYAYLGIITYTYNQKHSEYGTILFALASTAAVPFLETNPLAGAWLRKFLVMCSIIPIYLFAGVCKVRYLGVPTLVTGRVRESTKSMVGLMYLRLPHCQPQMVLRLKPCYPVTKRRASLGSISQRLYPISCGGCFNR